MAGKHPAPASFSLGHIWCQQKIWQEGALGQIPVITCNWRWAGGDIQPIQGGVDLGIHKAFNGIFVTGAEELFTGIHRLWK